ncbi:WhiB family transcriptional regulator [Streptomyces sp. NPDC003038]|uniref:WhiB family transcriptional regulator n=1 Tax=unclassified Streptomyces TaxID=2593676 RepID=UPI0033AF0D87
MPRIPRPNDHRTLPRARTWKDDAACLGVPTQVFFALGKGPQASADEAYAKSICVRCPVRSKCLTHALTAREDYGVWGGLNEDERAALLAQARRAAERQRRKEREKAKADASAAA